MSENIRWCEAEIFPATRIDPAEYCENEAEEGRDYCAEHFDPEDYEADLADMLRDQERDLALEYDYADDYFDRD